MRLAGRLSDWIRTPADCRDCRESNAASGELASQRSARAGLDGEARHQAGGFARGVTVARDGRRGSAFASSGDGWWQTDVPDGPAAHGPESTRRAEAVAAAAFDRSDVAAITPAGAGGCE